MDLVTVHRWLSKISVACGLRQKAIDHRCRQGPRLQDLRHTFATRRLVEWYESRCELIGSFLHYLEHDRRNCARSRNNRLSAIHAFFTFVGLNEPALASRCQRMLAIPFKRFERGSVEFLTQKEADALLNPPDTATWLGQREQLILEVAVQTGLRNLELTQLRRQDIKLGTGAHICCLGKGHKA
jgi:site-specific recombinase XerD